jgi:hypothetical protein
MYGYSLGGFIPPPPSVSYLCLGEYHKENSIQKSGLYKAKLYFNFDVL